MRTKDKDKFYEIIEYINDYYEMNDCSPSIEDVARRVGMSKSNVHAYIMDMDAQGLLKNNGRGGIDTEKTAKMKGTKNVALVGSVACGMLTFAEENIEEYFSLPTSLVGNGKFFLLRASGNSMIGAGINNGDLVLIRQQNTAEDGQIIVALVDNETTLKRFYKDKESRRVILHPENKTMEDIIVDHVKIQGVAIKVLKDLA